MVCAVYDFLVNIIPGEDLAVQGTAPQHLFLCYGVKGIKGLFSMARAQAAKPTSRPSVSSTSISFLKRHPNLDNFFRFVYKLLKRRKENHVF